MALSRRLLSSMGIEDEKIDQIIEAHRETVDGLKDERDEYKEKAEKLDSVQKELDDLKAQSESSPYKSKYEDVKGQLEKLQNEVNAKEAKAAKEKAVRAYYESKGIKGGDLELAMRASTAEIEGVELENGKIKNTGAIDNLVNGIFTNLVNTITTKGADTATPPAGGKSEDTREHRAAKIAAEYHQRLYGGTTQNTNTNANNQTNKS